jgi:hypothetical protein
LRGNQGETPQTTSRREYGTGSVRYKGSRWTARYYVGTGKQVEKSFTSRDAALHFLRAVPTGRPSDRLDDSLYGIVHSYRAEDFSDGFVYMIEAGQFVKIGFTSKDLRERLQSYISHCPFEVRVLFCVPGSLELEKKIHVAMRRFHFRNEWFTYANSMAYFINTMAPQGVNPSSFNTGTKRRKVWAMKPKEVECSNTR